MSDMQQNERPGAPGTPKGETGPSETDSAAPSVEGRDPAGEISGDDAG